MKNCYLVAIMKENLTRFFDALHNYDLSFAFMANVIT